MKISTDKLYSQLKINESVADSESDSEYDSDSESDSESEPESDKKPSKDSVINQFKTKHCVGGKLMNDGKEVTSQQIKDAFPNIKFSSDSCNPCDEDCNFEIISSSERLTTEENLKPVDTTNISVNRSAATAKSQ